LENSDLSRFVNIIKHLPTLENIYLYCEASYTGIDQLVELFANGNNNIQDYQINFGGLPAPTRLINELINNQHANKVIKKLQTSGINITIKDTINIFNKLCNLESFNVPINYYNSECNDQELFTSFSSAIGTHKSIKELFLYQHYDPNIHNTVDEEIKKSVDSLLHSSLGSIFSHIDIQNNIELLSIDELPSEVVCSTELFNNLSQCHKLQVLKISNGSLDNNGIDLLSQMLLKNNSIYFLALQNNSLSNEKSISQVLLISNCIKELDISGNQFIGTDILLSIIKNNQLNSLTCNSDYFSPEAKSLYNNVINSPNTRLSHHVCHNNNDRFLRFFQ